MTSVAEAIFFQSDIDTELFGKHSIKIGDRDWWDSVGLVPPSLADERGGMMTIRATRLLVLVCKLIHSWGVSDNDAINFLGARRNANFETIVGRSRHTLFASVYAVLAVSSKVTGPDTWFHRPNRHWNGETPLSRMLGDADGLEEVLNYLENAISPVTYLTEDM